MNYQILILFVPKYYKYLYFLLYIRIWIFLLEYDLNPGRSVIDADLASDVTPLTDDQALGLKYAFEFPVHRRAARHAHFALSTTAGMINSRPPGCRE